MLPIVPPPPRLALRKPMPATDLVDRILERTDDDTPEFLRIRCPHCDWEPDSTALWCCAARAEPPEHHRGCGTSWHTFDTRGRCPGCDHQWAWTACLRCSRWARHDDWYVSEAE